MLEDGAQVRAEASRDHLEHLPGRAYFLAVGAIAVGSLIVAVPQLLGSDRTSDTVIWGLVVAAGLISIIALAVSWEERRAHVHALVREVVEAGVDHDVRIRSATAELLRLGAHREVEYIRASPSRESG